MTQFNELGRGKLASGLAKLLNVNDMGALRSLAPEISSVVQLPVSVEEQMGAGGWGRWSSGFNRAPTAGQYGRVRIRNPVGSGAIVIVEGAFFSPSGSLAFFGDGGYGTTSDLGTVKGQDFRDGRTNPRGGGIAIVSDETNAGTFAGSSWACGCLDRQTAIWTVAPLLLMPGNGYDWTVDTVNIQFWYTLVWRERGATPQELAFK